MGIQSGRNKYCGLEKYMRYKNTEICACKDKATFLEVSLEMVFNFSKIK